MVHGGLQCLVMLLIGLIYAGIGVGLILGGDGREDKTVGFVFILVIAFVLLFTAVFFLPQLLGGYKLYKEKRNARIWGIVGSMFACISFPLGTAAGVSPGAPTGLSDGVCPGIGELGCVGVSFGLI